MYKVLNNMAPEYLRDLFHSVSETHGKSLRSGKELLSFPLSLTAYYEESFTVVGAREWKSLQLHIKKYHHPVIQICCQGVPS